MNTENLIPLPLKFLNGHSFSGWGATQKTKTRFTPCKLREAEIKVIHIVFYFLVIFFLGQVIATSDSKCKTPAGEKQPDPDLTHQVKHLNVLENIGELPKTHLPSCAPGARQRTPVLEIVGDLLLSSKTAAMSCSAL